MFKFLKKDGRKAAQKSEESILLLAKNAQIKGLRSVIEQQQELIDDLTKMINSKKKQATEDKVIDAVVEFFKPSTPTPKANGQQKLESGTLIYSDEEIKQNLGKTPKFYLKKLLEAGEQSFIKEVKNNVSNISDESAERSYVLAKEMI